MIRCRFTQISFGSNHLSVSKKGPEAITQNQYYFVLHKNSQMLVMLLKTIEKKGNENVAPETKTRSRTQIKASTLNCCFKDLFLVPAHWMWFISLSGTNKTIGKISIRGQKRNELKSILCWMFKPHWYPIAWAKPAAQCVWRRNVCEQVSKSLFYLNCK